MADKTSASTFGERFAFARWWQDLTRHETDQQFAEAVGFTKGSVSGWRSSLKPPPLETVALIAARTGVDLAWLLGVGGTAQEQFPAWLAAYRKRSLPARARGRGAKVGTEQAARGKGGRGKRAG